MMSIRITSIALVALIATIGAIAGAQESDEATETETTDEATEVETEGDSTGEPDIVEVDCSGLNLEEFTARIQEVASNHDEDPPSDEAIQEMFTAADDNGNGVIGPREGARLHQHVAERHRRHRPEARRAHPRAHRHWVACRRAAE
jgi:Ca2+-binding EF-hand superfamily protein